MRARALALLGLAVSAAFAYLAVRNVRWHEVVRALQESNGWWLAPALAVLVLTIPLRGLRWRFLFAAETRPPLGSVTGALVIGLFFNTVLPARAGELARLVALGRRAGTPLAESAATVVVERAFDVLCLLVLLFATLAWLPPVGWLTPAVALAAVLGGALLTTAAVLAAYGDRPLRSLLRPLGRLPLLSREGMEGAGAGLARGLAGIRRPRLLAAATLLTTLSWLLTGLSFWFVMLAFGLGLSPVAGLFVVIAAGLAQILPSSPGAVGVFEAAVLVALRAYGVSDSRALSYALVLHALNIVPYVAAGYAVIHRWGSWPRQLAGVASK